LYAELLYPSTPRVTPSIGDTQRLQTTAALLLGKLTTVAPTEIAW
jgi:hypothetical protein